MTIFDSIKFRLKELMADTPWFVRPFIVQLLRAACGCGLVKREKYVYARMGFPKTVLSGPFLGMAYLPISYGSMLLPKITGSYEKELHPHILELKGKGVDVIVDIGSAEGYYAIGLTRLLRPKATLCFDANPDAHAALRRLAVLNEVNDTVEAFGFCAPPQLEQILAHANNPLVFVDCEGGEFELLDPIRVPSLSRATIIVELHYARMKSSVPALEERFIDTHHVASIEMMQRRADDCVIIGGDFSATDRLLMVEERRQAMENWLVMTPRNL
jgi:hypothetical protein